MALHRDPRGHAEAVGEVVGSGRVAVVDEDGHALGDALDRVLAQSFGDAVAGVVVAPAANDEVVGHSWFSRNRWT